MKIAFLSNQLTLRGTEVALFDYAHYNETILANESIIITRDFNKLHGYKDCHIEAYNKFNARFPVFYYETLTDIESIIESQRVHIIFIEKAGSPNDGLLVRNCFNIIHSVFTTNEPHGELYCGLHRLLNDIHKTNVPIIPYIVRVENTHENLKAELNIPENAIVFGTYSGADVFNINYIRSAVESIATDQAHSNIYFIFLNIHKFGPDSDRIKFLPGTSDLIYKRKFINTCDAMLYGRDGGETFGLACGEFSICDKPVIAISNEPSGRAHIMELEDDMIKHNNYSELYHILTNWNICKKDVSNNGYKKYTPEYVMNIFKSLLPKL